VPAEAGRSYVEVMLAYDFPLLSLILSMVIFFVWVAWLFLVFRTVIDIFRSEDLGGLGKAVWMIVVVVAPYLGVFAYVVARGRGMTRREVERGQEREAEAREYLRSAVAPVSVADELAKLGDLRDRGILDDAEFASQKARLIGA